MEMGDRVRVTDKREWLYGCEGVVLDENATGSMGVLFDFEHPALNGLPLSWMGEICISKRGFWVRPEALEVIGRCANLEVGDRVILVGRFTDVDPPFGSPGTVIDIDECGLAGIRFDSCVPIGDNDPDWYVYQWCVEKINEGTWPTKFGTLRMAGGTATLTIPDGRVIKLSKEAAELILSR